MNISFIKNYRDYEILKRENINLVNIIFVYQYFPKVISENLNFRVRLIGIDFSPDNSIYLLCVSASHVHIYINTMNTNQIENT